ncbi:MAG: hypothetical protein H7Z38_17050 [Rubrivivax sp.]|nr:hypothetical protein [Pyrinomonadaceae bacterium]
MSKNSATSVLRGTVAMLIGASIAGLTACKPEAAAPRSETARQAGPNGTPEPTAPAEAALEKDAILEALRVGRDQPDTVFVVQTFNVEGGWAWVTADPQSADGTQKYERESWLVEKTPTGWKVAAQPCAEEGCEEQVEIAKIRQEHPSAPAAIFPK